jgi:hypothetical protein
MRFLAVQQPKDYLEGQCFEEDIALRATLVDILIGIKPSVFVRVFAEWKRHLQQCIDRRSRSSCRGVCLREAAWCTPCI